jgi:serine/threonine protein kinase
MNLENELRLSYYKEITALNESHHVKIVQHIESGKLYVLKTLSVYDRMVYDYLAKHPSKGMPKIIEMIEDSGTLFVVEEYIAGESLKDMIARRGKMRESDAVRIIDQLCGILRPLHTHQPPIVHRDIKPSNLIVTSDGTLVLVDFNTAKESDKGKKQDTVLIGTVGYAAPEQYGFAASKPTTDIYAIGVLLNELLTGHHPGQAAYSGPLSVVIGRCVQMDPNQRYQTVDALQRALHMPLSQGPMKGIRGWLPPGLGSKRVWVVILSALWYLFFISLSLTLEIEDASPGGQTVYRVTSILLFSLLTLFIGNYRNVWNGFPLTNSKNILIRLCGILAGSFLIIFAILMVMAVILRRYS